MGQAAIEDEVLWKSFIKGDKAAFELLYNRHFANLFEYGNRLVADRHLVNDYIHDLFVKLWTSKGKLAHVQNPKAYLLTSLRNSVYNQSVNAGRTSLVSDVDESYFELNFSAEATLVERETASEQTRRLLQALNALSYRQREVIYLKYFQELEYDEIAAVLNISTKATYKLSARALDALKAVLNKPEGYVLFLLLTARLEWARCGM